MKKFYVGFSDNNESILDCEKVYASIDIFFSYSKSFESFDEAYNYMVMMNEYLTDEYCRIDEVDEHMGGALYDIVNTSYYEMCLVK